MKATHFCFSVDARISTIAPMGLAGRYTVELFKPGGEGAGLECVLDSDDVLDQARALYGAR